MNERIRELWTQAGGCHDGGGFSNCPQYTIDDPEKFAELIVKECAKRLMQDDFGSIKGVMRIAGAKLKEHFEVKP